MRRPRLAVAGVLAGTLVLAAPGVSGMPPGDGPPHVAIEYASYSPATLDVVAGDTVGWENVSVRRHTVTDDAGAFDSGTIATRQSFAHRFESPGAFPYHCRLHAGIIGEVRVWQLLLARPQGPAAPGAPYQLRGRTALAPGTAVSIEADDGAGGGFQPVATAAVGPDGDFSAVVTPSASTSYRAVAGDSVSPAVQVLVLDRDVTARARRGRRSSVVSVSVTPPAPGGLVVLQLRLREHFGWWPVARARLGRGSRARFVLHTRRAVSARALLTLPDGATALATSPVVRVGPAR